MGCFVMMSPERTVMAVWMCITVSAVSTARGGDQCGGGDMQRQPLIVFCLDFGPRFLHAELFNLRLVAGCGCLAARSLRGDAALHPHQRLGFWIIDS